MKYICEVCGYVYDPAVCPICGVGKDEFKPE